MAKERKVDQKKPGDEPLKGKERTLGFSHGLTQPKWPKKEINGEDLLKAQFSSRRDKNSCRGGLKRLLRL